jgi:uncharacterized protein (DUF1800 family)
MTSHCPALFTSGDMNMSNTDTLITPQADTEASAAVASRQTGLSSLATATLASATLAACGGGGDAPNASGSTTVVPPSDRATRQGTVSVVAAVIDTTKVDAHRLLTQATFGSTTTDLINLKGKIASLGTQAAVTAWVTEQMDVSKVPRSGTLLNQSLENYANIIQNYYTLGSGPGFDDYPVDRQNQSPAEYRRAWWPRACHVSSAWWKLALTAKDQLRQRVAFALSEVLVVSMGGSLSQLPFICASYYDLLLDGAFGNYRDLITKVASHPAMGMYLSHLGNQRPDTSGRIPDQNFARELMQLFTLGLYKLNMDGSLQLDTKGKPQDTYTPHDVRTLSHVFTGWSWNSGGFEQYIFSALDKLNTHQTVLMSPYAAYHSKKTDVPLDTGKTVPTFLGKTIVWSDGPNGPVDNRKAALDIIFAHQNLAPFIAKQLIQRLVTSNPSTTYVAAAAKAFKDSNFNLGTLVKAILTNPEAWKTSTARSSTTYGKLKEPLLRVTQYMRAFDVKSTDFAVVGEFEPDFGGHGQSPLGQGALEASSVFNFFRPGYVAPGTRMGKLGKLTPEMQTSTETDISRYGQVMQRLSYDGFGVWADPATGAIKHTYGGNSYTITCNYTTELGLLKTGATSTDAFGGLSQVIQSINDKLFAGTMSLGLRQQLAKVADSQYSSGKAVPLTASAEQDEFFKLVLSTMLLMVAISPEYMVQR